MVIHPKLLLCVWLWIPRKETLMDHRQLSMVADKFQWVFSEPLLNACGTDTKFCRRMRTITPFRLGLALTATCASQRVETLADFHRGFNAVFDTTITYKAFYLYFPLSESEEQATSGKPSGRVRVSCLPST
jgi:hypothetical protein